MTVGVLRLELAIPESNSLKDKRRAIKSLKDRLSNAFNVSVAEVEELDSWRRAVVAVALVANEGRFVQSCLDKIVDHVRREHRVILVDYEHAMY
ncbi:MAG: DUF503 domain-containing protein [Phycisphaerales bacterium]|nr:DUF503 domain-containing protein [Phycisphaerales bacterium]